MSKKSIVSAVSALALTAVTADKGIAAIGDVQTQKPEFSTAQVFVGNPDLVMDYLMLSGGDRSPEGVDRTLHAMLQDVGPKLAEMLPKLYRDIVELGLADDRAKLAWSMLSVLEASTKLDDATFKSVGGQILDAHLDTRLVPYRVAQASIGDECDLNRPQEEIDADPLCIPGTTGALGSTSGDSGGGYGG